MLIITGKEMGAFGFLFSPKFTVRLCAVKKMGVERGGEAAAGVLLQSWNEIRVLHLEERRESEGLPVAGVGVVCELVHTCGDLQTQTPSQRKA